MSGLREDLKQKRLDNKTIIAWTMNEYGRWVMVNSSFTGIVELHPDGQRVNDDTWRAIKFEWRDASIRSSMPDQVDDVTLTTAKQVAQTAYMFHGASDG